ncbi:transposase InsO family protein [Rhodobium orientis]|nr:transposase InsO family protein [Rhodobium orientis]
MVARIGNLHDQFVPTECDSFVHSDISPEFVAHAVRTWIKAVGATTAYIEPASPGKNGYCESFNAQFRDELLDSEIFYSLSEAQILIEQWRKHFKTKRPLRVLGYRPPAPGTIVLMDEGRSCTNNQHGPLRWG